MNPVMQWVALPDGSHDTFRVPITAYSGMTALARGSATLNRPAKRGFERIFGSVDNAEEANDAIDLCTGIFFLIAGLNVLLGFFYSPAFYFDAALVFGVSLWLRMSKSRLAGGVLLAIAILMLVNQFIELTGMMQGFGGGASARTLMMCLISLGLAFRAFNATAVLKRGY
ncbi:MAG TPA: hypothetical protein VF092_02440 [Longimicrobium sp.]